MPAQKPRTDSAPRDIKTELEKLRRILARRLAWFWSRDPRDEIPAEVDAWLVDALWFRHDHRTRARIHAGYVRARSRRQSSRWRRQNTTDAERLTEMMDPLRKGQEAITRLWRGFDGAPPEENVYARAGVIENCLESPDAVRRLYGHSPHVDVIDWALRALHQMVETVRYEEMTAIVWVLGEGKTNAPQIVAALALAELGWSTSEIASTLPAPERIVGSGRTSRTKDKAQVRRMTRAARSS